MRASKGDRDKTSDVSLFSFSVSSLQWGTREEEPETFMKDACWTTAGVQTYAQSRISSVDSLCEFISSLYILHEYIKVGFSSSLHYYFSFECASLKRKKTFVK